MARVALSLCLLTLWLPGVPARQARPPEWRWRTGAEDRSAWYPSARVIAQPSQGDWRSVVDRVKADWPR